MDYEKAYREALERAKNLQKNSNGMILNKWLIGVFPELVEPEDEKIRKELIKFVKVNIPDEERYIAWLEKQDINCSLIEEIKKRKNSFMREKEKAVSSNDKLSLGARIAMLEELLVFVKEKQGQKPTNDTDEEIVKAINDTSIIDIVDPKFKVGEFVITDKNNVVQIRAIENGKYVLENTMRFSIDYVDKCWHLWTIQDAKDGDVLVNGSNIFIFHFINETRLMGYCHINTDDGRFYDDIGKNECFCLVDAVVYPASKEQCDLLFKKMKESRYEWDANKKKLRKIGQKQAWSDKDEEMCKIALSCIETLEDISNGKNMHTDIKDWIKSIKDRVQPKQEWSDEDKDMVRYIGNAITCEESSKYLEEKGINMIKVHSWLESLKSQPKQEWSEEDEVERKRIIGLLEGWLSSFKETCYVKDCKCGIIWLKSLKPRPKQEWCKEDENYLQSAENACAFHFGRNSEIINWLKSIKYRATWKPSHEQMEIFKELVDDNTQRFFYPTLKSLYNDLKKLKEE